ncbi:hypothetical protein HNR62_001112 [Oceanisphaera litoralis]|uniref:DUF2956 family protein n=1 Tax=Oceanisphaera litoralis TaxID=225144 RepID=UPI0019568FF5|nr:DUF2956 family protein [Oceanisphaera litoralis]MBM7455252.1 hypothetical protein [Oceanisphaera litoralis]
MAYNKHRKTAPSPETREEADRIARATQRPGQTKEQTRLISQGIQKGIEEYKKQHKARARAADKAKKQQLRQQQPDDGGQNDEQDALPEPTRAWLPWLLLALSWTGFALYWWWQQPG